MPWELAPSLTRASLVAPPNLVKRIASQERVGIYVLERCQHIASQPQARRSHAGPLLVPNTRLTGMMEHGVAVATFVAPALKVLAA